jgi:hypothetical protein
MGRSCSFIRGSGTDFADGMLLRMTGSKMSVAFVTRRSRRAGADGGR